MKNKFINHNSLFIILIFFGIFGLAKTSPAEIIAADRLMDWSQAGVPGGIPNRMTICATIKNAPAAPQTTTGSISAGSNQLTVASTADFEVGHGVRIAGAAFVQWTNTCGADLYTTITSIDRNVITTRASANCSVTGALVSHNTSAALNNAIADCPENQVVYVPAGTYNINGGIGVPRDNVTLRGDGPGKTIFTNNSGTAMTFGTQSGGEWPPAPPTCPILSGATKGSPTITVDSTSATSGHIAFTVGNFIQIQATANPPFVHNMGVASYDTNLAMTFRVTGLTSNTVTFTPAIPMDFSSYSPSVAIFSTTPKHGIGLENFTIDLQNTGTMGINFGPLWGSWVTNVEIKNSYNHILALWEVNQSEISHNYFHDNTRQGPNTEGLDFLRASDWNLITDNIVWNGGGIVIGDWNGGIVGNVIAYNYAYNQKTSNSDVAASDIDLNHGSNNFLNLIEGNIVGGITSDGYYGSNSHYTIFRNWATITNPTATNNLYGLRLKHFSDYFNVVGNVFGTSAFPTNGTISNGVGYGGFYETPQISGVDDGCSFGMTSIYELGFPGSDCNTWYTGTIGPSTPIDYSAAGVNNALDLNVAATLIRHGNYDYYSRNTIWDPNISDHNIPTSLYLTSKPSFFGNLPWPPIGPDLNPMTGTIPAKARYDGQSYPYGPTDTTPPAAPSGLSVN